MINYQIELLKKNFTEDWNRHTQKLPLRFKPVQYSKSSIQAKKNPV